MKTNVSPRQQIIDLLEAMPGHAGGKWVSGMEDTAKLLEPDNLAVEINLDGERFTLAHAQEAEVAGYMLVECRFGKAPAVLEAEVYAKLLGLNFQVSSMRLSAFAMDAESGNVIYTYTCKIAETTSKDLIALLDGIRHLAAQWRRDFFLGADGQLAPDVLSPQIGLFA
jgi:hypothetical protein